MKGISTCPAQNRSAILGNNCSLFSLKTRYLEHWNGFYATLYSLCHSSQGKLKEKMAIPQPGDEHAALCS